VLAYQMASGASFQSFGYGSSQNDFVSGAVLDETGALYLGGITNSPTLTFGGHTLTCENTNPSGQYPLGVQLNQGVVNDGAILNFTDTSISIVDISVNTNAGDRIISLGGTYVTSNLNNGYIGRFNLLPLTGSVSYTVAFVLGYSLLNQDIWLTAVYDDNVEPEFIQTSALLTTCSRTLFAGLVPQTSNTITAVTSTLAGSAVSSQLFTGFGSYAGTFVASLNLDSGNITWSSLLLGQQCGNHPPVMVANFAFVSIVSAGVEFSVGGSVSSDSCSIQFGENGFTTSPSWDQKTIVANCTDPTVTASDCSTGCSCSLGPMLDQLRGLGLTLLPY